MAKRTYNYKVLPWQGGLVTSVDDMLISGSQLTIADNITIDFNNAKRRREGINYNWDDAVFVVTDRESTGTTRTIHGTFTNLGLIVGDLISIEGSENISYNQAFGEITAISGTEISYTAVGTLAEAITPEIDIYWNNKVIGGIDYWFGSEDAKAQWLVTVLDNGAVYRTAQGARDRILDEGEPWIVPSSGLVEANLEVFQNYVVIAISGLNNRMKYWNGDVSTPLRDLPANLIETSVSRSSSGTTRTLVFSGPLLTLDDGDDIIITNGPADYNGNFVVLSGGGTDTITYTAGSTLAESSTPDTDISVGIPAPLSLFIREHQGRLFANDKTRLDRLHYSGSANLFQWQGVGDSGAVDIGEGDGDPSGLTGIAPTFKGDLFVGKRTKLYRIRSLDGDFDLATLSKVSTGIGFLSHQGIVGVDQDDLFFVSDRGIHSMAATDAYGDFTSAYLSRDIQSTFVEDFTEARKRFIKAAYLPQINSAAFSVAENGSAVNNSIYLYNTQNKEWYRWPDIGAETLISAQDTDRRRIYLGTYRGRLAQTLTGASQDTLFDDSNQAIFSRIATGSILVDDRPDTVKAFKRIRLIYRGEGSYVITCKIKIDNFSEQAIAFSSPVGGAVLGDFLLGTDILGGAYVTAPYSLPVDGYGRTIKLTIEQNDLNTRLAIQGFMIEYAGGGEAQETRLGDDK